MATADLLLGVDVGTSGLKAVLLDAAGTTVDEATATYGLRSPQPGWTEQDPDDWWAAFGTAIAELRERGHGGDRIAAIGLTGQMHSLVVLDGAGEVLCPAILWSDNRTGAECVEITKRIGRAALLERTGNLALAGFTAPKMLWIRKHWPDAWAKAAHLLLPKDFIRFRLSGDLATDPSDASGMLLLDVKARRWADDVIAELGIPRDRLAEVVEGSTVTGHVSAAAASALGLRAGTPIVAGGGDNAAAAVGLGAVDPGVLTLSIGTSGVIFAPLDRYPDVVDGKLHVFCHALPDRWHLMAVTLSAGGSLHWLRDVLAPLLPAQGDAAYDWMMERAAAAPVGSGGVVFQPYLSGERTPVNDPAARGSWTGLHLGTGLDALIRSVLEGVAFSQRQGLDLMREAGATASVARGAGGGLNSPLWRSILADALGVGIQLAGPGMGAARGAAVLGGLGVGAIADPTVGVDWSKQPAEGPDADRARALDAAFATYQRLYPALAPVGHAGA
ncbi:MAG: xylulokinase [Chloroflexota bacterium]